MHMRMVDNDIDHANLEDYQPMLKSHEIQSLSADTSCLFKIPLNKKVGFSVFQTNAYTVAFILSPPPGSLVLDKPKTR